MPAWFSKLFKADEANENAPDGHKPAPERSAALNSGTVASAAPRAVSRPPARGEDDMVDERPKQRRVIEPTILADEEKPAAQPEEIRVKARLEKDGHTLVLMIDRPVLEGCSAWYPMPQAADSSPLAQAIFGVEGADSVLIHGMNITVTRDPFQKSDWVPWAREIASRVREHLKAGNPVVVPGFLDAIPSEEEIRDRLQTVINTEINPGIASHSGAISLERIEGNTVYIRMMGGCQGCAASTITLRQGIHQAFREAVPELGAILDQTDHTAGTNPYYRQLPAGMEADA